jgi:hypothetical protein
MPLDGMGARLTRRCPALQMLCRTRDTRVVAQKRVIPRVEELQALLQIVLRASRQPDLVRRVQDRSTGHIPARSHPHLRRPPLRPLLARVHGARREPALLLGQVQVVGAGAGGEAQVREPGSSRCSAVVGADRGDGFGSLRSRCCLREGGAGGRPVGGRSDPADGALAYGAPGW